MTDCGIIDRDGLGALIELLTDEGYRVIGPTVRDGAIAMETVSGIADLPAGWTEEQDGGEYRLKRRNDDALFGYAVGPHSPKNHLFPPRVRLWRAARDEEKGFRLEAGPPEAPRLAFLGIRACELAAIGIQDRVLGEADPVYGDRRREALFIAVNCGTAGGACFCVSMETGPRATGGYDLSLTEWLSDDGHRFIVEVGSERGEALLDAIPHRKGTVEDRDRIETIVDGARREMGRTMETEGIYDLLMGNLDHPRWDDVAERCLSCANCTLVCPTCFCHSVHDVTDLTGDHTERWREWDTCFSVDFTYIHGGSVRPTTRSRYRQWLTHKLATWHDQFDTTGCVGCGRCITWCPVAIDITEEVQAIRGSDAETT